MCLTRTTNRSTGEGSGGPTDILWDVLFSVAPIVTMLVIGVAVLREFLA